MVFQIDILDNLPLMPLDVDDKTSTCPPGNLPAASAKVTVFTRRELTLARKVLQQMLSIEQCKLAPVRAGSYSSFHLRDVKERPFAGPI